MRFFFFTLSHGTEISLIRLSKSHPGKSRGGYHFLNYLKIDRVKNNVLISEETSETTVICVLIEGPAVSL